MPEMPRPDISKFDGFDHLVLWVANAKQAATFYCARFGFTEVGYRGLETGDREYCYRVLQQNRIFLVLKSPLNPDEGPLNDHIRRHGDGVKDVAFRVDDAANVFDYAVKHGAEVVRAPWTEEDAEGKVVMATIKTFGDSVHTFVQRSGYTGFFLPGFRRVEQVDPLLGGLPACGLQFIDHTVGNQPDNEMVPVTQMYEKQLAFHRFWSVDDSQIHTDYSSLRSIVVTDYDETIKIPINEPANGIRKSQIQEYVDYYGGPGIQHVALNTSSIIDSVTALQARGLEFLKIPTTYYDHLRKRLAASNMHLDESLDTLQKLHILVDYDENGYLLQIFTKPIEDRPTLFYEIIQRHNHQGFGVGNFKSLFEAIEAEQALRGNI